MKTFSIFAFAVMAALVSTSARAASLNEANAAFAAGKFHESTAAYQAVLDEKGYSAPVLYDLGNSLYREGRFAEAILAYKRAQWLAPDDVDIAANLQAAQKQAGVTATEPGWWERYTAVLSASGWAWLGCAAWTLLCACWLGRVLWPGRGGVFTATAGACAVVLALAVAAMVLGSFAARQGVVVAKNAAVLISPFPAAQTVFSPAAGETLTLHKSHNDYLRVSDATGRSGWIDQVQLVPVVKE